MYAHTVSALRYAAALRAMVAMEAVLPEQPEFVVAHIAAYAARMRTARTTLLRRTAGLAATTSLPKLPPETLQWQIPPGDIRPFFAANHPDGDPVEMLWLFATAQLAAQNAELKAYSPPAAADDKTANELRWSDWAAVSVVLNHMIRAGTTRLAGGRLMHPVAGGGRAVSFAEDVAGMLETAKGSTGSANQSTPLLRRVSGTVDAVISALSGVQKGGVELAEETLKFGNAWQTASALLLGLQTTLRATLKNVQHSAASRVGLRAELDLGEFVPIAPPQYPAPGGAAAVEITDLSGGIVSAPAAVGATPKILRSETVQRATQLVQEDTRPAMRMISGKFATEAPAIEVTTFF
jgi:hypothetical protein